MTKPLFSIAVMEHGGGANRPMIRLRFTRQDHTVPPVDFYIEGQGPEAVRLEGLLAELKGSELDPGEVVDRVSRDYDLQECAMRIYAGLVSRNPDQYMLGAGGVAQLAFDRAHEFIAEARRREEEE